MNERAKRLKEACEDAIKKWRPDGEETYCNLGLRDISVAMGYFGFKSMLANDIVTKMQQDPEFAVVDGNAAFKLAQDGRLVIAGQHGEAHGHVAACFPSDKMAYSNKWKKEVPILANVGKTNGIMGANFAFVSEPKYWTWIEEKGEA